MNTSDPTDPVAELADLSEGTMKMVRVDGQRVCLVRTATGVHALDHACPHEGYGLTQGALDGEILTCAWHNWKFRVSDGACVLGQEGVQVHDVDIDDEVFNKCDYHIHVPAGAIPKDGPSAGVAMFVSLVSLLQNQAVRPDVAMTGEITLRGLVLPIGGLKEKILAAKQAGIKTVILPARNKKDMEDLPKNAKTHMTFEYVKTVKEALKIAMAM